eukprot:TRINITY_DN3657_c0_g1_i1.p1 TRINITY_DN3657_c0_g1~~TRINITY_DN3657_c0_g1_i1.p1  ORF type:complete len:547 (+),score=138.35 TRINITY_DN3657_c0_g1_i1:97-1641(+)
MAASFKLHAVSLASLVFVGRAVQSPTDDLEALYGELPAFLDTGRREDLLFSMEQGMAEGRRTAATVTTVKPPVAEKLAATAPAVPTPPVAKAPKAAPKIQAAVPTATAVVQAKAATLEEKQPMAPHGKALIQHQQPPGKLAREVEVQVPGAGSPVVGAVAAAKAPPTTKLASVTGVVGAVGALGGPAPVTGSLSPGAAGAPSIAGAIGASVPTISTSMQGSHVGIPGLHSSTTGNLLVGQTSGAAATVAEPSAATSAADDSALKTGPMSGSSGSTPESKSDKRGEQLEAALKGAATALADAEKNLTKAKESLEAAKEDVKKAQKVVDVKKAFEKQQAGAVEKAVVALATKMAELKKKNLNLEEHKLEVAVLSAKEAEAQGKKAFEKMKAEAVIARKKADSEEAKVAKAKAEALKAEALVREKEHIAQTTEDGLTGEKLKMTSEGAIPMILEGPMGLDGPAKEGTPTFPPTTLHESQGMPVGTKASEAERKYQAEQRSLKEEESKLKALKMEKNL